MRIVFLGPPGVGKGTQAPKLALSLHVPHVSTGDMLRAAASDGTRFGREVKAIVESGQLVSDDVMERILRERLTAPDCARGFLLDGYPRTVGQARFLERLMAGEKRGLRLDHVLLIEAPREELNRRLTSRGRSDDTSETVARRLDVYETQTAPLSGFFLKRGLIRRIDGSGTPDEVAARIACVVRAVRDVGAVSVVAGTARAPSGNARR